MDGQREPGLAQAKEGRKKKIYSARGFGQGQEKRTEWELRSRSGKKGPQKTGLGKKAWESFWEKETKPKNTTGKIGQAGGVKSLQKALKNGREKTPGGELPVLEGKLPRILPGKRISRADPKFENDF